MEEKYFQPFKVESMVKKIDTFIRKSRQISLEELQEPIQISAKQVDKVNKQEKLSDKVINGQNNES